MKRTLSALFCLGFFAAFSAGALEFELTGGVNGFTFDREIKDMIIGNIGIRNSISASSAFSLNITRDTILKNSIDLRLLAETDYFSFEFGPFVGMSDNLKVLPNTGITGGIGFSYPGIAFLSLSGSSTLGSYFGFTGGNTQESAEAKLGFWLPNVIPVLSAGYKSYTTQTSEQQSTRDMLIRYQFSADIFAKNFPFTLRLDGGYEILTRYISIDNVEQEDKLKSWFAGLEVDWQIARPLKLTAGFETPFLLNEPIFRYKITAGLVYTFF